MKKLTDYYNALSKRDKKASKLFFLFTPILISILFFQPLYHFYTQARLDYYDAQQLLTWMHNNKVRVSRSIKNHKIHTKKSDLLETISSVAEKEGITIDRIVPKNKSLLRVWFNNVEFVKLLTLLNHSDINPQSLIIDKTANSGLVSAQLTLTLIEQPR